MTVKEYLDCFNIAYKEREILLEQQGTGSYVTILLNDIKNSELNSLYIRILSRYEFFIDEFYIKYPRKQFLKVYKFDIT